MFTGITRALCLLATLLLASCDNSPHPPPERTTTDDGQPWKTRYVWSPSEPKSLDPQNGYDTASRVIMEPIYDTLMEYDPWKTDPFQVMPGMLSVMPTKETLPDGRVVMTCRLKKGITFHDDPCFPGGKGREVTAHDAYYTWQRMSDPKVECPILAALGEYVEGLWENFQTAKKNGDVLDYAQPLRGVEVVDDYTFRIYLKKPYPQLIYWMAMQFCSPVAREAVEYYNSKKYPERDSFSFHPVGHGPYAWVKDSYVRGQRIRVVRHPRYITSTFPTSGWPAEREAVCRPLAGKSLPLTDELQILYIKELLPVWLLTKQGYLDRYGVQKEAFNAVVTNTYGLSPELKQKGMTLEKDTEVGTFYAMLNMKHPLLGTNKKLRQALSCAYDPARYSEVFYDGVRPISQQLIPPGLAGYRKDFKNPYGYDLTRGKRLLAEAGYPDGRGPDGKQIELTLDFNAARSDERLQAEFIKDCFEALGIKIQIIENDFARLLQKQETGNYEITAGSGWSADYPDPENFLMLLYSKNFPPSGKNEAFFKNAEYDALYEKMASMDDGPERLAIVIRMADIIAEEVPLIMNVQKAYYTLIQPWAPRSHANVQMEGGLKYQPLDPVLRAKCIKEWNRPRLWPLWALGGAAVLAVAYAVRRARRGDV